MQVYLKRIMELWNKFPLHLNTKSPTHLLLDFYQRLEDVLNDVCGLLDIKKNSRFGENKHNIENKLGSIFSKEMNTILECAAKLRHEQPKNKLSEIEENLFIDTYFAKIDMPHSFLKYSKSFKNQLTCSWIFYKFMTDVSLKCTDYFVQNKLINSTTPQQFIRLTENIKGKIDLYIKKMEQVFFDHFDRCQRIIEDLEKVKLIIH